MAAFFHVTWEVLVSVFLTVIFYGIYRFTD
jgi:hypothetical protein